MRHIATPMVEKSLSATHQQDAWIKDQIDSGHYGNESEVLRELSRERQLREWESPEETAVVRAALAVAEESGKREG